VKKDTTPIPASGVVSISFVGNKKFTSEQLQKVVDGTELKLGVKVGPAVIAPAMKAVVDFYHKNGAGLSASPDIIEDPKGIVAVQIIIDENASKGDIGGLVSSGGPHIFCE
jgi:outer membrane protein assembly factor BamA